MTDTPSAASPSPVRLTLSSSVLVAGGVLALILFVLGLLIWQVLQNSEASLYPGTPAPDFTLETFDGHTMTLQDLQGHGVVLNFWASWCHPCREEAELLETAWRREQDQGVVFVGVAYLDQGPAARRYLDEFDITYPNGRDKGGHIAQLYAVTGVPATYFIHPDGQVIGTFTGPLEPYRLASFLEQIRP